MMLLFFGRRRGGDFRAVRASRRCLARSWRVVYRIVYRHEFCRFAPDRAKKVELNSELKKFQLKVYFGIYGILSNWQFLFGKFTFCRLSFSSRLI